MRREKSEFTLHASTKCHVSVDKCASGGDRERKGNDAESMYFKGTLRLCQTKKSAVAVYIYACLQPCLFHLKEMLENPVPQDEGLVEREIDQRVHISRTDLRSRTWGYPGNNAYPEED